MDSIILRTAARYLMPIFLLFSVIILLRGHNAPGGGFVGGLLAAGAFVFYALVYGVVAASRKPSPKSKATSWPRCKQIERFFLALAVVESMAKKLFAESNDHY